MTKGNDSKFSGFDRRMLLAAAGGVSLSAMTAGFGDISAHAAGRAIAGHMPELMVPVDTLNDWLKQLHKFGPVRNTGTPQARAFEEFLATKFAALGCVIERDQYRLTSWEADVERDCGITVQEDGGTKRTLEVLAYYPFSGSTRGSAPVSGRVLFAGVGDAAAVELANNTPANELAQSIVVLDLPIGKGGIQQKTKIYKETFPSQLPPVEGEPHPANLLQNGMLAMRTLEEKCKGLILCYTDVAPDAVRYNFLPFTDQHRKIPALWSGKPECDYLKSVSGKATATVRLDAKKTPNARADTILATMKGQSDEVVLMTTQTDGPNECNENGGLGLLACATYLSKIKNRKRTFVFSLPTGHYAFGPILDVTTGSGRMPGTFGVVAKWPDVIKRTVGQFSLEQMAATEWAAVDGKWGPTGRVAQEHWIPTPSVAQVINKMFMACTEGEDPRYWRADLIEDGFPGGEGGALRAERLPANFKRLGEPGPTIPGPNLPGIGLMGWPHYFFRADPKGVIDKLDPKIMHAQVSLVTKMLTLMDNLSRDQISGKKPIADADLFAA